MAVRDTSDMGAQSGCKCLLELLFPSSSARYAGSSNRRFTPRKFETRQDWGATTWAPRNRIFQLHGSVSTPMEELSVWIAEHRLKQAEAADILMVSRPRVSDVVNRKTAKFSIDTLVEMLSRVGKPVRLEIL